MQDWGEMELDTHLCSPVVSERASFMRGDGYMVASLWKPQSGHPFQLTFYHCAFVICKLHYPSTRALSMSSFTPSSIRKVLSTKLSISQKGIN